MIPILLKPKILSIFNRWHKQRLTGSMIARDLILLFFGIGILAVIYLGTLETLTKMRESFALAYLSASHPIGLVLLFLFGMLVFSNMVISIGSLFVAQDLDLIISSPLSITRLFFGKYAQIFISTSWMPAIFILPFLLAFGVGYDAPLAYYLVFLILLIPFFCVSTAISIVLGTLIILFIPVNRAREIVVLSVCSLLIAAYYLINLLDFGSRPLAGGQEFIRLVSLLSLPDYNWLPSNWFAHCLGEILEPAQKNVVPELILLISSALSVSAMGYLLLVKFHAIAYSKIRNIRQVARRYSTLTNLLNLILKRFVNADFLALIRKDLIVFTRDITQAIQLLLLIGICLIYLYNLKIFTAVETLPDFMKLDWKQVLFVGNTAIGAFLATAICTRLVFPSISLEGKSYWIVNSSPLSTAQIIRAKFWSWVVPVSFIASIFFAAGSYALGADGYFIAISAICACIICCGIVGVAIGCGAYFANFHWEFSTELAASFGSFIFMLISITLVLLSLLPSVFLIMVHKYGLFGANNSEILWIVFGGGCVFLLLALNYLTARLAMKTGEYVLLKRIESGNY